MPSKSVRVAAREVMQKRNYCPLEEIVNIAQAPETHLDTKLHIAETLLPYMYPKLSSVEIEADMNINHSAENQAILLRRLLQDPELADAAQRLSIAASMAALESEGGNEETIN